MSMIPESWIAEQIEALNTTREPDGYRPRRVRDRRWLWLRHKTIMVPYWHPIRRLP